MAGIIWYLHVFDGYAESSTSYYERLQKIFISKWNAKWEIV
jgi:hypothetical protein